jgi:phosphopantothenoylcysteine decarboxylase/phosphopantothenate--cysteine ligase
MAAAVADYRPARAPTGKIKRGKGAMTLELEPNPDILARATSARRRGQVYVGFALETSKGLERARVKLKEKGLDLIVLNSPSAGLGTDTNQVTLVEARNQRRLPEMPKREVAEHILDRALELRAPAAPRGKTRGKSGGRA